MLTLVLYYISGYSYRGIRGHLFRPQAGAKFCLSSVPASLALPETLKDISGFTADGRSVETIYADNKARVCLLDPSATKELSPEDGELFDVFLFGGILGELAALPIPPPC